MRRIDASWYQKPKQIRVRKAAGGIIARKVGDEIYIALIREEKFPDEFTLPKGGVEKGESLEIAARREIEEESGLTALRPHGYLGKKERLSFSKRTWAVVHYFLYTTTQITGKPTDNAKKYILAWFPLNNHPRLFWPEQEQLLFEHEKKIREAFV